MLDLHRKKTNNSICYFYYLQHLQKQYCDRFASQRCTDNVYWRWFSSSHKNDEMSHKTQSQQKQHSILAISKSWICLSCVSKFLSNDRWVGRYWVKLEIVLETKCIYILLSKNSFHLRAKNEIPCKYNWFSVVMAMYNMQNEWKIFAFKPNTK